VGVQGIEAAKPPWQPWRWLTSNGGFRAAVVNKFCEATVMRKRTKAREYALQLLYQVDVTHADPQQTIQEFWTSRSASHDVKAFAIQLVQGTLEHLEEINRLIAMHANNWDINRMAVVDRNILRMGAYELLYLEEVPPKVCLNEAVELAKRFGDEESSKFVNGILDTIHKTHARYPANAEGPSEGGDRPEHPSDSQTTTDSSLSS